MGKTAFVVSVLRNAAVEFNMPVAIFSLEMSSVQLVNRLISAEAEIDSEKIRKGNLAPHEWAQIHHRISRLTNAPDLYRRYPRSYPFWNFGPNAAV